MTDSVISDNRRKLNSTLYNLVRSSLMGLNVMRAQNSDLYITLERMIGTADSVCMNFDVEDADISTAIKLASAAKAAVDNAGDTFTYMHHACLLALEHHKIVVPSKVEAVDPTPRYVAVLLVDRTDGNGTGFRGGAVGVNLTVGFPDMESAQEAGQRWQDEHGDNPCWNAFFLPYTSEDYPLHIINPYTNKPLAPGDKMAGDYVRVIERQGTTDVVNKVLIFGPFNSCAESAGFGQGRLSSTGSIEWQCLGRIESIDQFVVTHWKDYVAA